MSELTVTLLRFGLLVLMWVFVFTLARVLKGDIYGTRVIARRPAARAETASAAASSTAPAAAKLSRAERRRAEKAARAAGAIPTHLVVTQGPLTGTTLPLRESGTLIGRNPECALVLDDDYASGRHLIIRREGQAWVAEDLGSTNGTRLGNQRITSAVPVPVGSQLQVGRTVIELQRPGG
ncbi:MAG: FHA domain-containing protein [Nostocoides sp.]